jgi:hypothetical protein
MKYFLATLLLIGFVFSFSIPAQVEAKSGTYYRSAKSGRYVTPSYSRSHSSTTYRSSFRSR